MCLVHSCMPSAEHSGFSFKKRMKSSGPWYWLSLAPGLLGNHLTFHGQGCLSFILMISFLKHLLGCRVSSPLSTTFHNSAHTKCCSYSAFYQVLHDFTPWQTSVGNASCYSVSPTALNGELRAQVAFLFFFFF